MLAFKYFTRGMVHHMFSAAVKDPVPALSGAAPPALAACVLQSISAFRQQAQLIAQTLHLPAQVRNALAQRRVLPLHKTRHRPPFREGALPLVQPFRVAD